MSGVFVDRCREQEGQFLDFWWGPFLRAKRARRHLEFGHGVLCRHASSLGPPKERHVEALGLIEAGGAESGTPHGSEQPVHGRAVDSFDLLRADGGREPPLMEVAVVVDGLLGPALFFCQVLLQEPIYRFVHRRIPNVLTPRQLRGSHLVHELCQETGQPDALLRTGRSSSVIGGRPFSYRPIVTRSSHVLRSHEAHRAGSFPRPWLAAFRCFGRTVQGGGGRYVRRQDSPRKSAHAVRRRHATRQLPSHTMTRSFRHCRPLFGRFHARGSRCRARRDAHRYGRPDAQTRRQVFRLSTHS